MSHTLSAEGLEDGESLKLTREILRGRNHPIVESGEDKGSTRFIEPTGAGLKLIPEEQARIRSLMYAATPGASNGATMVSSISQKIICVSRPSQYTLDDKKPYIGDGFIPASIQFMSQAAAGKGIGATPDGRMAGKPLCDSLGAIFGKDSNGPTALLKSVCSIELGKAIGVPVLNFNIDEKWDNEILKALIVSYMKMGGLQMQITCISKELLLEAYHNPDEHKNLIVRVGGYSEYFNRLSDELKKMIIDRTVQECRQLGKDGK